MTPLPRRHLTPIPGGGGRAPGPSDEELVRAVRSGDLRASRALYTRLLPSIDQTLYRVLGRRTREHEDLVQTSFEQVVLTLMRDRFAGACSLRTWASAIASRVGLNALRKTRRERRVFDATEEAPEQVSHRTPEQDASVRHGLATLRAAFSELPAEQAETVFLFEVLGHDLAEIAVLTGVSVAAAQSRLVRGRKRLSECMTDNGGTEP